MTTIIAFDVIETLLDLRALDPSFDKLLGSAALRGQWFAQMLQLSFFGGLTGEYVNFSTAQHAALRMLAQVSPIRSPDRQARPRRHLRVPDGLDNHPYGWGRHTRRACAASE